MLNFQTQISQEPNKNQYQLSQSLNLFCDYHQQELLTNFCSNPTCLRSLCPDCIDTHNKFHKSNNTFAEIDSIKNIKKMCSKKLNEGINEIQNILDQLENNFMVVEGDEQTLQQIRGCREQVIDFVEQYFSKLEDQYRQQIDYSNDTQESINQMLETLRHNLNQFEFLQANMEGQNTLSTIQQICNIDLNKMIERFKDQYKETDNMRNVNSVQLCRENQALDQIYMVLNKFAYLTTVSKSSRYLEQDDQSSQSQIISEITPVNLEAQKFSTHIKSHPVATPIRQQNEYTEYLTLNPFFNKNCKKQYLHFFQVGENNLWLFDLNNKQQGWQNIKISWSVPVPQYSKSIITDQGDIYLFGGILAQGQKSSSIFYMDLESRNLVEVGKMMIPRSSHSLILFQDRIAIIGGYSTQQVVIEECESFIMKTKKLTSLGNLSFPVASPSLCKFKNDCIIKIGGINTSLRISNEIELYQDSKWQSLKLQNFSKTRLQSINCCIQVGQDEILVFGGYTENNKGSDKSFLIEISNSEATYKSSLPRLPYAEGFWNNIPLVYEGQVYAIQNKTDEQSENCLEGQRSIIVFDGQNWI